MSIQSSNITADVLGAATRARRAIGALFFTFFGAAWVLAWARLGHLALPVVVGAVFLATAILMPAALAQIRRNKAATEATEGLPETKRRARIFHIVNVAQWVLILVAINVFNNLGFGAWQMPAVMMIVGAHFLPLARVFRNRALLWAGLAIMAVACGYPGIAEGGPTNPVGCLCTGLILWMSAAWAVRETLVQAVYRRTVLG